ncbi:MAG: hypothetical protein AB7T31_16500 [Gemmatimonadales bacterium]
MRALHRAWVTSLLAIGLASPVAAAGQRIPMRHASALQAAERVDWAPASASLLLPGAGQHLLGQNRKWAYLALEVAGWAFFAERRIAGGDYRARYRDLAWERARIQGGARMDGDFAYYERLVHWTRSGAYDADAGTPGLQPELDESTFNGSVWSLATRIHAATGLPETDPAYQSALAYYSGHAYGTEFLWDWSGTPGAQSEYAELLDTSDSRFRQATTILGVIIANHVLSATDAYLSARGRVDAPRLRVAPDDTVGSRWSVLLTVPLPR